MQTMKRVVALALEEAQSGFASLCQRMTDQAGLALAEAVRSAPPEQQRLAAAARMFLLEQGAALRARLERSYAALLTRAVQTMHTDLRTGLHDFRADTLTLIDDEVVTRQIEVERLVLRLRDADELSLGHLNLIIAQMHGSYEVKERENPFRPYLLARALYDALRAGVSDEALNKYLFEVLAAAMAAQLGGFYTMLREVFESRGIRSRLVARPSALNKREQERQAWQQAAAGRPEADQAMRQRVAHLGALRKSMQPPEDLDELVWQMFNQGGGRRPTRSLAELGRQRMDDALRQLQREQAAPDGAGPAAPLALRARLGDLPGGPERVVVDLVALLFEFIMNDDMLAPAVRRQVCRLQAGFTRAALQEPSLLQDAQHPARRLLDRIGSAAVAIGADSPLHAAMLGEVQRIIGQVLQRYEQEPTVFADADQALDGFLASLLRECDASVRRCLPPFERAAVAAPQLAATVQALHGLLESLRVDRRMLDFITNTWSHVMVHTLEQQPAFSALLPELVWSGQQKTTPEERAALMKLLPGLGRQLRAGLAAIGMPEQEALDALLSLHMDVMSNKLAPSTVPRASVAGLREHFSALHLQQIAAAAQAEGPRAHCLPGRAQFAAEFAMAGLPALVQAEPLLSASRPDDADWLQLAHAGAAFELLSDGAFVPLRLGAVGARQSGFLLTGPGLALPLVYPRAALLAALRDGSLRPLEYAPLFERAVESLMTGAESLAAA